MLLVAAVAGGARPADPPIPAPTGFVTDTAHVVGPDVARRIDALARELQAKTGAEIAVLTVPTTAPLDDFSYAMRVAEAWKVGKRKEDTGLLVLLAVQDRKVRVVTGYGLEGVLPDGLVGEIQDDEMVPEFRAGRLDEGLWRGVAAMAARIAADRGVTLTGVPPPRPRPQAVPLPGWALILVFLAVLLIIGYAQVAGPRRGMRGGGFGGPSYRFPGGFGGGGGGGGFGGFGGGSFGGGGAGRSW